MAKFGIFCRFVLQNQSHRQLHFMLLAQARIFLTRRILTRAPLVSTTTIGNREFTSMSAQTTADELIAAPVAVFSKSYCPCVTPFITTIENT